MSPEPKHSPVSDYLLELIQSSPAAKNRPRLLFALLLILATLFTVIIAGSYAITSSRESEHLTHISRLVREQIGTRMHSLSLELVRATDPRAADHAAHNNERMNELFEDYHELLEISRLDNDGNVLSSIPNPYIYGEITRRPGTRLQPQSLRFFEQAKKGFVVVFSEPYSIENKLGGPFVDIFVPNSNPNITHIARLSVQEITKHTDIPHLGLNRFAYFTLNGEPKAEHPVAETPRLHTVTAPVPPFPLTTELVMATPLSSFLTSKFFVWALIFFVALLGSLLITLAVMITGKNRREDMLESRILVQKTLNEAFTDGITVTSMSGRILYANNAFAAMTGYSVTELQGMRPPFKFWPPEAYGHLLEEFSEFERLKIREGIPKDLSYQAIRKDGTRFDCRVERRPVFDASRQLLGFLFIHMDDTAKNRAEASLKRAQESFERAISTMDAAVSVLSHPNGSPQILFANKRYTDNFGDGPEGHLRIAAKLHDLPPSEQSNGEVFDEQTGHWLYVKARTIDWIDGKSAELLTITDISERRRAALLLEEQLKNAEQSARLIMIGETASSIAHEINQPLAAIQNYASAAQMLNHHNKLNEANADEAFSKILRQTTRMSQIIQVLRSSVKHSEPHMQATDVDELVDGAMELALITARKLKMKIDVSRPKNIPKVLCDSVLIEQVLLNLLRNAMEASVPTGAKRVQLSIEKTDSMIAFKVIDHGIGLSEEVSANLFTPFFSTKSSGMGIGLNICRSIAETHHGRITAENNPEGGATFTLTLQSAKRALQSRSDTI